MTAMIINLGIFKVAWLATVLSAAAGLPLIGTFAVLVAVAVHLRMSANPAAEGLLVIAAALVGVAWESALVLAGLLEYQAGSWIPGLAPYWIVAMWVLFATTLNVGLRWLRRSTLLAVAAGAIGGPLAFAAGASTGAVVLVSPVATLVSIGVGWAVLLPLLVKLAERLEGTDESVPA